MADDARASALRPAQRVVPPVTGNRRTAATPVVDSHQHFWDLKKLSYDWMGSGPSPLRRNFLPGDLEPLIDAAGVDSTVIVQAHQSLDEARWIISLAEKHDFIAGTVCWVDLTDARLGATLDRLQKSKYFNGVRHIWHDEADDAWIMKPAVIRGLKELARREVPYDFLTFPQHLKYVPRVYDRVPGLSGVIDHISKPAIAKFQMEPWAADIARVAEIPGMHCKVSGMVTEARRGLWRPADLKPYVKHVASVFGYDRLMFGSDWPVCTLAGSYQQVFDAAREALGKLSETARAKVFGGNAIKFYRLAT
ncbi:MAG: amidohydrolase family protein [Chloroflexi bacterium]|nr:amidohydrolase family protein [Chloroflexota bacterium]